MGFAIPLGRLFHGPVVWRGMVYTVLMVLGKCATSVWLFAYPVLKITQSAQADNDLAQSPPNRAHSSKANPSDPRDKPHTVITSQKNIYAALLLSFAMTTRGEIGFLIAAVGQYIDILAPEDVYFVVIWAVILCTLLGSIGVGIVVFYIKKASNRLRVGLEEVLGVWG
jgi:hypothetical protein